MNSKITSLITSLLISSACMSAYAAPIVIFQDGRATGIQDLEVNGVIYDVAFTFGSYNAIFADQAPTFLGDKLAAYTATMAMLQVLQSEVPVTIGSIAPVGNLLTPFQYANASKPESAIVMQIAYQDGTGSQWLKFGDLTLERNEDFSLRNYAYAVYTPNVNAVPEPSSMALMGLGLAGLAFTQRKRAKTVQA